MKIKYWMTKDPITIDPDAPITEAARIMKEHNFRRLPVMENHRLVGLVTYRNILEAQPSPVSTLSKHEARYLVAKLKVRDVMRKNPITVSPDDNALTALMAGHRKGLGSYPVVDEGRLVGIVTATDLFNLIVHLFGEVDGEDMIQLTEHAEKLRDPGYLPRLSTLLAGHGIALLNFLAFPHKGTPEASVVLLKISAGSRAEALEVLLASGYQLFE